MIGFIRGELAEKGDGYIIVDVNGVGYEIFVPANSRAYLSEEGREVPDDDGGEQLTVTISQ